MYDLNDLKKYQFLDSIEGVPDIEKPEDRPLWKRFRAYVPGVLVCFVVTLAAQFIALHYNTPIMLMALLLGLSLNFLSQDAKTKEGIQFTSQSVLRLGVVLIGARIVFGDVMALGLSTVTLVVAATLLVIAASILVARVFKVENEQGLLMGGATAICGASAALAIASILPKSKNLEQNTLIAVIGVTAMGTISMIFYPVLIGFLNFTDYQAGIVIGGTIHDVSQVIGAGYSVSAETGDTAILIKLMRVFMLIPVLLVCAFVFRMQSKQETASNTAFPVFLLGFLLLVILNSFALLPEGLTDGLNTLSKWLLVMAIAAVGMKTSPKTFVSIGWSPFLLVLFNTALLIALYMFALAFAVI